MLINMIKHAFNNCWQQVDRQLKGKDINRRLSRFIMRDVI